jgi:hypothetical protein
MSKTTKQKIVLAERDEYKIQRDIAVADADKLEVERDALKLALEEIAHYLSKIDGDPGFSDATADRLGAAWVSWVEKHYKLNIIDEVATELDRKEWQKMTDQLRHRG